MNADVFQDRWSQVRAEAQRRWNRLTDQDLDDARDNVGRLTDAVETRYHLSRTKAEQQVSRFVERYGVVQARAEGFLTRVRDFARDNPWVAVAAAVLLIGVVSGLLARPGTQDEE